MQELANFAAVNFVLVRNLQITACIVKHNTYIIRFFYR